MFRSFGLDEKIAGNMREKHRALTAAETAEQYAEWWLSNGNGYGVGTANCTAPAGPQRASGVCERDDECQPASLDSGNDLLAQRRPPR